MSEPRVLFIHQNFVSARQAGNARAIHVVAALLEAGWAVDVVCTVESYLGHRLGDGGPRIEREGALSVHRLSAPRTASRSFQYLDFCARAGARAWRLPRPDVVLASTPPLPQLAPALWLAAWYRVPLVLEVRDLWPAFLVEGGLLRPGVLLAAMQALEALGYRRAERCIAVSPGFVPYLEAMGVRPERLTLAPTGGDPHLVLRNPAPSRAFRERHELGDRFLALYAGSFNEAYGTGVLLEAARLLADSREVAWVFAGGGRGAREIAEAAAGMPAVRWLGALPKDDLLPALGAASAGVNLHAPWPLLETTLTGKLFDYLSAGLPVIDLAGGLMGRLVETAGAGHTIPRDPRRLAEAVLALARMAPERRAAMGECGRRWVLRHAPAAASARAVATAVEQARSTGRTRRSLVRDGLAAFDDVRRRRSRRALAALYGPDSRDATLDRAFTTWVTRVAPEPAPLPVPTLLRAPSAG